MRPALAIVAHGGLGGLAVELAVLVGVVAVIAAACVTSRRSRDGDGASPDEHDGMRS